MPPIPDPYTPGEVPRVLIGREIELQRVRDRVSRVATFGEMGGPLLVFHAPRGVGKTSLLRTAQQQAAAVGCVCAWVACTRKLPFLPELAHATDRALVSAGVVAEEPVRRRWRERLDRVSIEVGPPGVRVKGEIALDPDAPPPAPDRAPIGALEDLLHDAATLARGEHGAGLILFLDELHAASADDLGVLLNAIQNLSGERERHPVAVVAAGLPVTPEAITRAATFGERSDFAALDLLSDEDARALLTAPAETLEIGWSADALELVTDECRGHPYLLQLLGSATWRAASPEAGDILTAEHVRAGVPAAQSQLDAMYRARWGVASPAERGFIRAMADLGDDNVGRAAIAARLGTDSRALSVPRESLIEKGVIEPVGHGLVRFTLPGFAEFVRHRAPA
ncbi:ATP-binding protein [Nocardioides insulae]|uniref:ATP-binding protein n=1 Tax=Nocardioides insulae TaxID=394734 RepID=UPI0003FAC3CB|nr:ATP-binding protein [Nocardioides insulae]